MLQPRIIPCLLVKDSGLVKTVNFKAPKYLGDPINAVRIFNEKEVDELIVIDIDATIQNREPDYKMIEILAAECRMPLCYGGGIKNSDQVQKIIQLGVEKVAISSEAIRTPELISESAEMVGNQSVIVVLDVKKNKKRNNYEVWTHNNSINTGLDPVTLAIKFEQLGAGEIVINSIDHDGAMKGYDLEIVEAIRKKINLPITVLGGAGTLTDIEKLIREFEIIGAAAGSLFVFKGSYKAVLINYPNRIEKESIINNSLSK